MTTDNFEIAELTKDIVTAFVSYNSIRQEDLPELINSTFAALVSIDQGPGQAVEKPIPMVPIKKSITKDYLISLEDGRRYKSLKRHLTRLGLTPNDYRAKWDLPDDYPMVAPNYAKHRSELAKSFGLGQVRQRKAAAAAAARAAEDNPDASE